MQRISPCSFFSSSFPSEADWLVFQSKSPSSPLFFSFFFLQPQFPLLRPCAPPRDELWAHRRAWLQFAARLHELPVTGEVTVAAHRPFHAHEHARKQAKSGNGRSIVWMRMRVTDFIARGEEERMFVRHTFLHSQSRVGRSDRIASRRCVGGLITDLICVWEKEVFSR